MLMLIIQCGKKSHLLILTPMSSEKVFITGKLSVSVIEVLQKANFHLKVLTFSLKWQVHFVHLPRKFLPNS